MHKPPSLSQIATALGGSPTPPPSLVEYVVPAIALDHIGTLKHHFEHLMDDIPGISGIVMINSNGSILVSTMPETLSVVHIAAMANPWLRIADRVVQSVNLDHAEESVIRTPAGMCSIRSVHGCILITLLESGANLGLFWHSMQRIDTIIGALIHYGR